MADKGKKRKVAGGDEPAKKKAKQEVAATSSDDPTAALESFIKELEEIDSKEEKEMKEVRAKYQKQRKPVLKKRDDAIAKIDGFWAKAFGNHPTVKAMVSEYEGDQKLVEAITKVEVEEEGESFKLVLHFKQNDYIKDKTLSHFHTVEETEEGAELKIENSGIQWKVKDAPEDSFFNMAFGKENPASADIASLLEELKEVYYEPVPFFKGEIAGGDDDEEDDDDDGEAPQLVEDEDE